MCQFTAYILKDGKEEALLADDCHHFPERKKLQLISLFGEEEVVQASSRRLTS